MTPSSVAAEDFVEETHPNITAGGTEDLPQVRSGRPWWTGQIIRARLLSDRDPADWSLDLTGFGREAADEADALLVTSTVKPTICVLRRDEGPACQ